jgi:hypothetical protein
MATLYNKIFSGYQLCQVIKRRKNQGFVTAGSPRIFYSHDEQFHNILETYHKCTYKFQSTATRKLLTLGICFLVCDGDFAVGRGGLDGGAGLGGGFPNLGPRSVPSVTHTGIPNTSSSGPLAPKCTDKSDINNSKHSTLWQL